MTVLVLVLLLLLLLLFVIESLFLARLWDRDPVLLQVALPKWQGAATLWDAQRQARRRPVVLCSMRHSQLPPLILGSNSRL